MCLLHIYKTDPDFQDILSHFIFGEVFHQGDLDLKLRELITLVVLTVNQTLPQLRAHVQASLNVGLTPVELKEAIYQCAPYIGFPKTLNAIAEINEQFKASHINLPLESQRQVEEDSRFGQGLAVQVEIFGEIIAKNRENVPSNQKHIQDYLSAFCFGDLNGPFMCICGYSFSQSQFSEWIFSPTITCTDTLSWLENSSISNNRSSMQLIPNHIYKLNNPIKAFNSIEPQKLKYIEVPVGISKKGKNSDMGSQVSTNIILKNEIKDDLYKRLFDSTKHSYKGINSYLRKGILMEHKLCTEQNCLVTNKPCHHIWAYKRWHMNLFGGETRYRNFINVKQHSQPNEFEVIGKNPYKENLFKMYSIIHKLLNKNIWPIRRQEIDTVILWIISNTAADYYLQGFNDWLTAANQLSCKASLTLSEKKQISQLDLPVTIFEYFRTTQKVTSKF